MPIDRAVTAIADAIDAKLIVVAPIVMPAAPNTAVKSGVKIGSKRTVLYKLVELPSP
jgi:hypothetical protein